MGNEGKQRKCKTCLNLNVCFLFLNCERFNLLLNFEKQKFKRNKNKLLRVVVPH